MDLDSNILPWLGRTSKVVDYFIADYMLERGISLTKVQMILLYRLQQVNGAPQNSLAYLTNRDKASLTRLITTLERKNLVARIPSKSDGRVNKIYITKFGEEIMKQTLPIMDEIMKVVQNDLSKDEIILFISILKKVNKNINSEQFVAPLTN